MENDNQFYSRKEISTRLRSVSADASKFFNGIEPEAFFKSENSKWSPAENLRHLAISSSPVTLSLNLPKFSLRIFGFPNRTSRTYDEVVKRYHEKLASGGKAGFFFTPKKKKSLTDKKKVISTWNQCAGNLANALDKWKDEDLDKYLISHPLLGKLTIREMMFFTIYHIKHHTESVRKMTAPAHA